MAGSVQLYSACAKAGIKAFPGTELYVVRDRADTKAKRHHMGVVAYSTKGYENLVRLNTLAHTNFHHKPLIDHNDLASLADAGLLDGIAATSGCYFSLTSQAMVSGDVAQAQSLVASYAKWFGKFYIELQNHNIEHDGFKDDDLADSLYAIAQHMGIPCVITQDAHYCHTNDKETHDALKRLVAFGADSDDAVFPGDGFHLADADWFARHHHPARLSAGIEGLADLLDSHTLSIPALDSYSYNIPFTVADQSLLRLRRSLLPHQRSTLSHFTTR
jgi:DNA polymerase III alpha subunit